MFNLHISPTSNYVLGLIFVMKYPILQNVPPNKEEHNHIQKSQTFEPTVNKSCGKLMIEGNATTTKKCMEIEKFREISLDQFVKV